MKSSQLRTPLLCLGLLALAACGKKQAPPQMPPPQVGVISAKLQSAPLTRNASGRLSPYYSANVTARVSGVLLKRNYTEGSAVKQGQLLFEIDPAYYQTQLNNALSVLAQDQAVTAGHRVEPERRARLRVVVAEHAGEPGGSEQGRRQDIQGVLVRFGHGTFHLFHPASPLRANVVRAP